MGYSLDECYMSVDATNNRRAVLIAAANIPNVFAPAATFTVYVFQAYLKGSDSLDTVKAFTSLALITLVTYPASRVLSAIPNTARSIGCFDRIQEFLLRCEDNQVQSTMTNLSNHPQHGGEDSVIQRHSVDRSISVSLRNASIGFRNNGNDDTSHVI